MFPHPSPWSYIDLQGLTASLIYQAFKKAGVSAYWALLDTWGSGVFSAN